ncbi:MAG: hypothetical protein LBE25_13400 [Arthrobacter sp.]|nr:hypothetical protein [Arthrobacter sp.]
MSNPAIPALTPLAQLPEAEAAAGPRTESWRVELLNLRDAKTGELDGITAGTVSLNVNATLRRGGSLSYVGDPVDWARTRVRPVYSFVGVDGVEREWGCGVLIPASPGTSYEDGVRRESIELYDKVDLLDQDAVSGPYQVTAGAKVVDAVRKLLNDAGETRHAIEDSTETVRTTKVWEPGTTRLRIINDLLQSINYAGIYTDPDGVFRSGPYVDPAQRPTVWEFRDDETSIYTPDLDNDRDTYKVANRVICLGESSGDKPGLVAVAEDTDPASPTSYPSRGRWITRVEEGVDAATQDALNAYALRLLTEEKRVGSKWQIQHSPVRIDLSDVVVLVRDAEGIEVRATVETIDYDMSVGALCKTTLKEVQ